MRLYRNVLGATDHFLAFALFTRYFILLARIVAECRKQHGRRVFPLILGLYLVVHIIIIFHIQIGPWKTFANSFARLPFT